MTTQPPTAARTFWIAPQGLFLVVALAAVLRFSTLGYWPLWIDEAFTLHDAQESYSPRYPFGYAMTRWVAALLGKGEFALRLAPCLFGIATVALLARPRPTALETAHNRLAGLLLAISSWHLFWSQSARYYAPLIFFIVLAAHAIPDAAEARSPRSSWRWLLASLSFAVALSCHPTAVFFLPGAVAYAWPALEARVRRGLILVGGVGLGLAVWRYAALVPIHLRSKGQGSPVQLLSSYVFQAGPLMLGIAAFGLLKTLRAWRRGFAQGLPRLEICFGVLTGALFLVASLRLFVTGYHAIATLPFALLLASRAALGARGIWRVALIVLLLAEQLVGLGLYHSSHGMRPRYSEAADVIRADPCERVYATQEAPLAYYLSESRIVLRDPPEVRPLDESSFDDVLALLSAGESAWVVTHVDDMHKFTDAQRAHFARISEPALNCVLPGSFGPKKLELRLFRFD